MALGLSPKGSEKSESKDTTRVGPGRGLAGWIGLVGQSDTRRTDENMMQDGVSHFGSVFFSLAT